MTGIAICKLVVALTCTVVFFVLVRYILRVVIAGAMMQAVEISDKVPGITPAARVAIRRAVYKACPVKTHVKPPPVDVTVRAYRGGKEVKPRAHD